MADPAATHPAPGDPVALYLPDGATFVPTIAARGPWSPDAQHGGPVAALLCRAAESVGSVGPLGGSRPPVELLRPAPLTPLTVVTRIRRPGKRVQLVEAVLLAGETEIALATALRIRLADVPLDGAVPPAGETPDGVVAPPPPTAQM